MKTIKNFSEKELINLICNWFGDALAPYPEGSGDDCAVLSKKNFSKKILSTSDAVILGKHFLKSDDPFLVGRKVINRNISDIASMGGLPKFVMCSAIISHNTSLIWLEKFCMGMRSAALDYNVKIIGGDLASFGKNFFSMHITLLGTSEKILLRKTAQENDLIFVTGVLGASFESKHHLSFLPKINEGLFLNQKKIVSSCIDISDGLASDIKNILPKNTSAFLNSKKIPLRIFKGNNIQKALCDGEDYELLFTINPNLNIENFLNSFQKKFKYYPSQIGKIKKSKHNQEIFLDKILFSKNAYSHFM